MLYNLLKNRETDCCIFISNFICAFLSKAGKPAKNISPINKWRKIKSAFSAYLVYYCNTPSKYNPTNKYNIPQHVKNIVDVMYVPVGGKPLRNLRERIGGYWYHNYAESVKQEMCGVLAGVRTEQIQEREFLVHSWIFRVKE